jgi:hypothetical protein
MKNKLNDYFDLLDSVIEKYNHNVIFVNYNAGFGGNAIRRIISASPEVYFRKGSPLKYPDNTEGFVAHEWEVGFNKYFKKQHLAACHDDYLVYPPKKIKSNIELLIKFYKDIKENRVCITTHKKDIHKVFNCKTIRTVGKFERAELIFNVSMECVEPVFENNVFNLRVNKLFSKNYDEFENEYLHLCGFLNIFPQINSVRSFILLWLEKQRRFLNES